MVRPGRVVCEPIASAPAVIGSPLPSPSVSFGVSAWGLTAARTMSPES